MTQRHLVAAGAFAAAVAIPFALTASPVPTLTQFQAGQPVRAADFNANFAAVKTAVDDNDRRIGNLANLQTSAKTDLVAAINEARSSGGAQGPQGPQGPTRLFIDGGSLTSAPGGGTNTLAAGSDITRGFQDNPWGARLAGRSYTCTLRLQTVSPAAGGDNPGAPTTAGNLMIDAVWTCTAWGNITSVLVTQANVATLVLDAGVNNDKTITFTGTVPAMPTTPGGLRCTNFTNVILRVNAGSAVNGQFIAGSTVEVTLP